MNNIKWWKENLIITKYTIKLNKWYYIFFFIFTEKLMLNQKNYYTTKF